MSLDLLRGTKRFHIAGYKTVDPFNDRVRYGPPEPICGVRVPEQEVWRWDEQCLVDLCGNCVRVAHLTGAPA